MIKIVPKKNIPSSGDIVEDVKFNKDRTLGCLIFDSGKKVFFSCNPVEFGKKSQPATIKEDVIVQTSRQSKSVDTMTKNSPLDSQYQNRVLQTLARMRGVSIEQVQREMAEGQDPGAVAMLPTQPTAAMEDFESRKQAILEKSEARSRRMAEELSRSSGGRLENSFGGKISI